MRGGRVDQGGGCAVKAKSSVWSRAGGDSSLVMGLTGREVQDDVAGRLGVAERLEEEDRLAAACRASCRGRAGRGQRSVGMCSGLWGGVTPLGRRGAREGQINVLRMWRECLLGFVLLLSMMAAALRVASRTTVAGRGVNSNWEGMGRPGCEGETVSSKSEANQALQQSTHLLLN